MIPFYSKPTLGSILNLNHPLVKDLVFCAPLNEGGGPPRDIISRTVSTFADYPAWQPKGLYFDGSNDNVSFAIPDTNFLGPITILVKVSQVSNGNYRTILSKCTSNGATNSPFDIYTNASGILVFSRASANGVRTASTNTSATDITKSNTFVLTATEITDSMVVTVWSINKPNYSISYTGSGTGAVTGAGGSLNLGLRADSTTKALGTTECVYIWNRILTPDEINSIGFNPWQIFRSKISLPPYLPVAGGDVTGNFVVTESVDVGSFLGKIDIAGTFAAIETKDTGLFNGVINSTGSFTVLESKDVASLLGIVGTSGSFTVTEPSSTASFNGIINTSGSFIKTETGDTSSEIGVISTLGNAVLVETRDIPYFNESGSISGTFTVTETKDQASISGFIGTSGRFNVIESSDLSTFVGMGIVKVIGTLNAIEGSDIAYIREVQGTLNFYNKYNGTWQTVSYIKVAGSWKVIYHVNVKINGTWH